MGINISKLLSSVVLVIVLLVVTVLTFTGTEHIVMKDDGINIENGQKVVNGTVNLEAEISGVKGSGNYYLLVNSYLLVSAGNIYGYTSDVVYLNSGESSVVNVLMDDITTYDSWVATLHYSPTGIFYEPVELGGIPIKTFYVDGV